MVRRVALLGRTAEDDRLRRTSRLARPVLACTYPTVMDKAFKLPQAAVPVVCMHVGQFALHGRARASYKDGALEVAPECLEELGVMPSCFRRSTTAGPGVAKAARSLCSAHAVYGCP